MNVIHWQCNIAMIRVSFGGAVVLLSLLLYYQVNIDYKQSVSQLWLYMICRIVHWVKTSTRILYNMNMDGSKVNNFASISMCFYNRNV